MQKSSNWSSYFVHTTEIYSSYTSTWNISTGWIPIESNTNVIIGVYKGQGYLIDSLYINRTATYIGLFGYCYNVPNDNLGITNLNLQC